MEINTGDGNQLQRWKSKVENNKGWNFRTNQLSNLAQDGVIDPVKVTKTALQNAASCAGTLITTNHGIIQTEAG